VNEEGTVSKATVIKVLTVKGVSVKSSKGDAECVTLFWKNKDGKDCIESHAFPAKIGRLMLQRLSHHCDIPIFLFYNPDML
jgi:hypothetical protein